MASQPPARGAVAGARADAKARQLGHDTGGVGNAYSHNFLNQKPWHPLNFRNQMKKWEVEQQALKEAKAKETAMAEFQAEQEKMATYSLLSEAEQKRYKDRQSIAFMYAKPPGLEAALAKDADKMAKAAQDASAVATSSQPGAGPSTSAPGGSGGNGGGGGGGGRPQLTQAQHDEAARRMRDLDRMREDPFAVLLSARAALQNNERLLMKQDATHGGYSVQATNQQLLEDEEGAGPGPSSGAGALGELDMAVFDTMDDDQRAKAIRRLKKLHKEQERERKLREAEEVLRSAGYDLSALPPAEPAAEGHKKKRKHKHKDKGSKKARQEKGKEGKRRHKKHRRRSSSGSSSSGSGSD